MVEIALIVFVGLAVESLPVSSSTHVLILDRFLNFLSRLPGEFDHFLFGPTIIVIMVFFYKEWRGKIYWFLPSFLMINPSRKRHALRLNILAYKILSFAFIANVIAAVFYFAIKQLKPEGTYFLSAGLVITCLLLVSLRFKKDVDYEVLDLKKVIILGVVQGLALLPGISRLASTYVAGRYLNLSPRRAFQASLLIELPIAIVAFLKGTVDLVKTPGWQAIFTIPVIASFILGTIASLYLLGLVYRMALEHKFWWFGLYMPIPILITVLMHLFYLW